MLTKSTSCKIVFSDHILALYSVIKSFNCVLPLCSAIILFPFVLLWEVGLGIVIINLYMNLTFFFSIILLIIPSPKIPK